MSYSYLNNILRKVVVAPKQSLQIDMRDYHDLLGMITLAYPNAIINNDSSVTFTSNSGLKFHAVEEKYENYTNPYFQSYSQNGEITSAIISIIA